jgi:hypothetical protein
MNGEIAARRAGMAKGANASAATPPSHGRGAASS